MFPKEVSFYAQWRARQHAVAELREGDLPSEQLVQRLWFHQRLRRDALRLGDGRPVRILHPGFWNHGAGPDFREAMLQFAGEPPVRGDVEVDLQARGWKDHAHDRNPAFRGVKLHVVWSGASNPALPTLILESFLDAPLPELALSLAGEAGRRYPEALLGRCAAPLRDLPAPALHQLLHEAAMVRFQRKAGEFQARARHGGWEQALWEGLLRALGYKQNLWPM